MDSSDDSSSLGAVECPPCRRRNETMAKKYPKHVFCIEGNWEEKLTHYATVKPVLELLEINAGVNGLPVENRDRSDFHNVAENRTCPYFHFV